MKSIAVFTALFLALLTSTAHADGTVVKLEIKGAIGVATADHIISGIEHAEASGAELVIIDMDTPGGLMAPMRDIVQAILTSTVPVATYVYPDGARADSAGTYILLASHIAAMAPTTHLGAATPVSLTGDSVTPEPDNGDDSEAPADGEPEEEPESQPGTSMERKVLNDAISYIRGLAERHGRNADWAEEAVREAATLTATEALEQNVIEFIAEDHAALLAMIDGHEVSVGSETVALETSSVVIEEFEPSLRIKILSAIANPEIVLILGMIGLYGLMYEGWNPGAIIPGVVGVICLLLAAYGLQVLPVNYAGLALIIVGLALMTAEAFAPSFGALGLGGIAAFVFGAIMMFDSGIPGYGISLTFVISVAVIAALLIVWLAGFVLKLRHRGAVSGVESIVGGVGVAMADFTGEGKIWLEGEAWAARSKVPIAKDEKVVVTDMTGLTLDIEPKDELKKD
ncbi:MAG: nodulation protein NfeD [Woeseiaceae bacterium]|nr:nodulation protein NfeD [Woeseiaceae bacterium]NIP19853.1 nodulation protein NfeD [Woeseiaceae bacterium]NIS88654.1 nodulation protein NfeD [Woeseiaceae bacterium]